MLRLAWIILALAALFGAAVHLRHRQNELRSQMHRIQAQRAAVRRLLWDQQLRLGELSSPWEIQQRVQDWPTDLAGPEGAPTGAERVARRGR